MDEKTRIKKDIDMFEDSIRKYEKEFKREVFEKVFELACQYFEDSKYYLSKKDYFTSFGCINYAHGLLDALFKI